MARTTKQLSGPAKDKMLRGLVAQAGGLTSDDAARVCRTLAAAITDVRVRRDAWDVLRQVGDSVPTASLTKTVSLAKIAPASGGAPSAPTPAPTLAPPSTTAVPTTAPAAFDAYAFSAVAVLTRQGKAALVAALESIGQVEHLRALAQAQHLAIDPALDDATAVRLAVIAATERRIAERKAAAS